LEADNTEADVAVGADVRVLVVDDNANLTSSARKLLEIYGANVEVAGTERQARRCLESQSYDLVLVDLMLPDGSGLDLINDCQELRDTRFVLMTGHPRLTDAVKRACPQRATFLPKPFSAGDLMELVERTFPSGRCARGTDPGEDVFAHWVGSSPAIARVKKQIAAVAPLNATVFLLGESGTGKELAADAIHRLSGRKGRFMTINCGAIPESLIANELFGHEKGSYTGASRAQPGLFERAEGGTVFLDEVTELPLEHQPTLLRVLETKSVTRIGGGKGIPIDVRVVAATNRVDQQLIQEKVLREDLFYRLMVFPIVLPPLRDRSGDIPEFVDAILHAWNQEHGTNVACSAEVLERLKSHNWPGNVRELKHTIQRLAILSDGDLVDPPAFFDAFAGSDSGAGVPVGTSIRELERRLILATLDHYEGDRARTASTLGISQKTLYNRLKSYHKRGAYAEPEKWAS
jgi:two-component system, NtrC family, response regulator HydG